MVNFFEKIDKLGTIIEKLWQWRLWLLLAVGVVWFLFCADKFILVLQHLKDFFGGKKE